MTTLKRIAEVERCLHRYTGKPCLGCEATATAMTCAGADICHSIVKEGWRCSDPNCRRYNAPGRTVCWYCKEEKEIDNGKGTDQS